jgi:hypothetical protein
MVHLMKDKFFLTLLFVLALVGCKGKAVSNEFVDFEGLKSVYHLSEGVSFKVHNVTKSNVFYYVGVQNKKGNEWVWGPTDIASGNLGKQGIPTQKIAPGEVQTITWPSSTTHPSYYPTVGVHRFLIHGACDPDGSYLNQLTPTANHTVPEWQTVISSEVEIK